MPSSEVSKITHGCSTQICSFYQPFSYRLDGVCTEKLHFGCFTVHLVLKRLFSSTKNPGIVELLEFAQLNGNISHRNPGVLVNSVIVLAASSILDANLVLREELHHNSLDHVSGEILSQAFPVTETKHVKIVSQLNIVSYKYHQTLVWENSG